MGVLFHRLQPPIEQGRTHKKKKHLQKLKDDKMAKNYGVAALVTALCLVGIAHCLERLTVEGPVYCDTCRVDFVTPLSYDLKGDDL